MDKLLAVWEKLQQFLDISGDAWLSLFTAAIIFRLVFAAFHHTPITIAEATAYGSAIGAFAASNIGKPRT